MVLNSKISSRLKVVLYLLIRFFMQKFDDIKIWIFLFTHHVFTSFISDALQVHVTLAEYRIHDVANVLKRYLRHLEEPLLTSDLYDKWIETACELPFVIYLQENILYDDL